MVAAQRLQREAAAEAVAERRGEALLKAGKEVFVASGGGEGDGGALAHGEGFVKAAFEVEVEDAGIAFTEGVGEDFAFFLFGLFLPREDVLADEHDPGRFPAFPQDA